MEHTKKLIPVTVIVALLVASGVSFSRPALAEDNGGQDKIQSSNEDNNQSFSKKDSQESSDGADEVEMDEQGLNEHLNSFDSIVQGATSSMSMSPEAVQTYSDVVSVLQGYQQAVTTLVNSSSATSSVLSGLSGNEMSLFDMLFKRHKGSFALVSVRGAEIQSQLQVMIDAVQPLGSNTISPLLRKVLVRTLSDFREEVKNLGELLHNDSNILDAETSF